MEKPLNCSILKNRKKLECKSRPVPIMPYFGGKQRVADNIIMQFPKHDTFVEPFLGGGAVYWKNTVPKKFIISDLNKDVYQVYNDAKNSPNKIKKCGAFKINSKSKFNKIKKKSKKSSCDIIALHKNGFGGSPQSYARKSRPMYNHFDEKHKDKLKKTIVLNKDFRDVARKYDKKGVVMYWDPPYFGAGKEYKTHGVTPKEVCGFAKKIKKAKVFISYDNHKEIKRSCKGLKQKKIKVPYTAGPGKTIIKTELLLSN